MKKLFKVLMVGILSLFALGGSAFAATTTWAGFSDVPSSHPNYTAIMDLHTRGIISGYQDNTFRPDQPVNRVEALKIILNAAKIDSASSQTKAEFTDIDNTQWYMPFLNKAVELKIVAGYPDHSFKPTQTVNLAENLKMLLNAEKIDVSTMQIVGNPYADVSANDWFAPFVQYAKDKKLIVANASNMVMPAQGMTRGKLAELAYRLIWIQENKLDYFGQVKQDTPGIVSPGSAPNDTTMQVTIKDMSFSLANMTVAQGTTVRWTNSDSVAHTVTSDTSLFNSPSLSNSDTWTYTFNDLGTFNYHCAIHPMMKGSITVKPSYMVPTI